jgi:hypothetical protein
MSHATSRATCRSNRTRDVGEVVDDEPARGRVNRTVGGLVPTVQKYRPVNRSNRPVYWEVKLYARFRGGNWTGSCTGSDRFHREPAEPDRFPPVLRTLARGDVVDDERSDEPRDVPKQPDVWHSRSGRRRAARCAEAPGRAAEAK